MKFSLNRAICIVIGWVEIVIGFTTILGCTVVQAWGIYSIPSKPLNVYIFVVVTAAMAFILGIGLLANREWARVFLLYLSGYIILTKILIYAGLLTFSGPIIAVIPPWSINSISFLYHVGVIIFLLRHPSSNK